MRSTTLTEAKETLEDALALWSMERELFGVACDATYSKLQEAIRAEWMERNRLSEIEKNIARRSI